MAANNNGGSSDGRKNFYRISYGALSTKEKNEPEDRTEIVEATLKSKTQAVENIDLRKVYVKKDGDYPYQVFYPSINGTIQSVDKEEYDKGISLNVTLLDADGDESVLQTKFYSKVSVDFLNRLLSVQDVSAELLFRPYAIPNDAEIDGKKVKFYNSGVSIKEGNEKLKWAFDSKNGLPSSERVQDAEGKTVTSRVKQVNFLWEKVNAKFGSAEVQAEKAEPAKKATPAKKQPVGHDSLPF